MKKKNHLRTDSYKKKEKRSSKDCSDEDEETDLLTQLTLGWIVGIRL